MKTLPYSSHPVRFYLFTLGILLSSWAHPADMHPISYLSFGRFDRVALYTPRGAPEKVVILLSGPEGWTEDMDKMARTIADGRTVIAGIDVASYLQRLEKTEQPCSYPAGDFEMLSKIIQKKQNMPRYLIPVLAGYSAGAGLAYAALAQAPQHTFQGAIGIAFCPELAVRTPLCNGSGLQTEPLADRSGYSLLASQKLRASWIVLQGSNDQSCPAAKVKRFMQSVDNGKLFMVPKIGHDFAGVNGWQVQFSEAIASLQAHASSGPTATVDTLSDLPIIEVSIQHKEGDTMAVILSGDGGWASIDRELGDELAKRGLPVIGFNSLQYFWKPRRPEGMAQDLARVLRRYSGLLDKNRIMLIGYSMGADVLPFMASRLPADIFSLIDTIALISPGERASFEFHLSDWLSSSVNKDSQPIQPEVERLIGPRIICIYGTADARTLCRNEIHSKANWKSVPIKGGHHLDGNYRGLADLLYQPKEHLMSLQKTQ